MFCKYCGKPLKENEICTCPEAQAEAAAGKNQTYVPPVGAPAMGNPEPQNDHKGNAAVPSGLIKKIVPLAAIVVVLLVLLGIVVVNRKTTIDMKDYIQISYTGMNTVGDADIDVDWMSLDNKALADSGNFLGDSILLESSIQVEATPTEDLSNGDTVTVTVTYDEGTAERLKLKFVNTTIDYTVSGLVDGVQTDVFADLAVTFEGIAPQGTVAIQNNSNDSFVKSVSFSVEPSSGLSNGDTVTVTARYNEQNAIDQMRVVSETTKTYTVSGLDAYVTTYDQIDQDTIDQMSQQAKDTISTNMLSNKYSYIDAAYDTSKSYPSGLDVESIVLNEVTLQTTYFAASKPDTNNYYNNELIQVYKVSATDNTSPDGVTFYYAVGFHDIIKAGDGSVSVKLTDTVNCYGNVSTDAIYNRVVAPLTADYTVTQA